ncbi:MAG: hypothetical protein Q9186_000896 [Xanthomendoza sp. 1 TL-2023]
MAESLRALSSTTRKEPLGVGQGKAKPQRLHPRQLGIYKAAESIVQPVQTSVASFINVVLDSGGTSVGNVLVPAESTIFNVDGYGPVTLDNISTSASAFTYSPENRPTTTTTNTASRSKCCRIFVSAESHDHTSPGVEFTSHLIISSYAPTTEPIGFIQFVVINHKQVIFWLDLFSNDDFCSTTVDLRHCVVADCTINSGCIPPKRQFNHLLRHFFTDNLGIHTDYDLPLLTTSNTLNQTSTSSVLAASTTSSFATSSSLSSTSSSPISSTSASASSTIVDTGVAGGGGTPTGTADANPSSSTAAAAGSGGGSTPSTPTLVGGVVGGLAGLALIIVLIIFLLRRRRQIGQQRNISPPIPQSASTGPGAASGTMTERSSAAVPFASAAFFRRLRPGSGATASTTETAPSERGFQNLGGRKLESVLSSRGDGFGDLPFGAAGTSTAPGPSSARSQPPPSIPIVTAAPSAVPGHSSPESLSGSSFYRDSRGFYGGPGQGQAEPEAASNSSSMVVGPASPPQSPRHPASGSSQQHEGIAVMRPGPARTPVTTQGGLSPMRGPPTRGTPPPPHIPGTILERPRDGLGRSHPSMDGSRGSRFAENI